MKDTQYLLQTYLKYGPVIIPCVGSQLLVQICSNDDTNLPDITLPQFEGHDQRNLRISA